jgi:hypothetical protein
MFGPLFLKANKSVKELKRNRDSQASQTDASLTATLNKWPKILENSRDNFE